MDVPEPEEELGRRSHGRRSADLDEDAEGIGNDGKGHGGVGSAAAGDWPEEEEYWMSYTPLDDTYRSNWIASYGNTRGSFHDETKLKPMRYTFGPDLQDSVSPMDTVQFFSVKVARIKKGLQWPLHVYGVVAVRDSVDHLRNIVFHRERDNPQVLTSEEDSFLELQGPRRAIVLIDPAVFEVDLKVKGNDGQTDDTPLAALVFYHDNTPYRDESHLETLTELTVSISATSILVYAEFNKISATSLVVVSPEQVRRMRASAARRRRIWAPAARLRRIRSTLLSRSSPAPPNSAAAPSHWPPPASCCPFRSIPRRPHPPTSSRAHTGQHTAPASAAARR